MFSLVLKVKKRKNKLLVSVVEKFDCMCISAVDMYDITRASDISRKKKQNFAGFSGANSRKNRPISRDFRGEKSQNSRENRPISRDFSGKKSNFEGFSGAKS